MVRCPAAGTGTLVERDSLFSTTKLGVDIEDGGVGDLIRQEATSVDLVEPVDCAVEVATALRTCDEGGVGDVVEGDAKVDHFVGQGFGEGELAASA